ncbi:MAG TPA: alpha/beta hydrolase, partial [Phycisphaerae bacterium]|nr:alpha/beta hydrolase [Phycisphaerae bacterium]
MFRLLCLCFLVTMLGCDRVFYYPDRRVHGDPAEHGLKYEDVYFAAPDGVRLHGWFFPATKPATGTVLHIHGNAANVSAHYEFIRWLPAAGYNVLTFDYRGYGQSGGHVT